LKFQVGCGYNNTTELYSLWTLLKVVVEKQVIGLQVLEDSKLCIDWVVGKIHITSLVLEHIMEMIISLRSHFEDISFVHINIELNHKVDHVSKETLVLEEVSLHVQEMRDNNSLNVVITNPF
jgi:hypothetical protein